MSDLTKLNYNECWELPVGEFFAYLSFAIMLDREEAQRMQQIGAQNI